MKAIEHPADVWVIVDADHHLAFAAMHEDTSTSPADHESHEPVGQA
jgi:hypothetical protein